jgi:hypothetical protein
MHYPNVVTVHESGPTDDGTTCIATEYLEGERVRDRPRKLSQMTVDSKKR